MEKRTTAAEQPLCLSRRHFLAAAGGAAVAATRVRPQAAAARLIGEKTRVAVIGSTGHGDYGHGLDRVWLEIEGAEIVGVADDDASGLAGAKERLGGPRAYRDFREMLEREKPRIVSVATRWIDRHAEMVEACAEHGAHVFLEKPMCRDLVEADRMVAACEKHGVRLAIAHQTRMSPKIAVIRDLIASGRLGRILELRGRGKEDSRGGGQDLWVLGTHVFDLMRVFAGDARWCFARVTVGDRPATPKDVHDAAEGIGRIAGDGIEAMFGFDGGVTAYFSSHRDARADPSRFGLELRGTKGIVEVRTGYLPAAKFLPDPSWSPGRTGVAWQDISSAGVEKPEPLGDTGLHGGNLLIARDLLRAIDENREPESSIYDARAATEMILAVFASHREGRPVALPLERREHPLEGWS